MVARDVEGISHPELVRLVHRLESDLKELYDYAHAKGHEANSIKTVIDGHIKLVELEKATLNRQCQAHEDAIDKLLEGLNDLSKTNLGQIVLRHSNDIEKLKIFMWTTCGIVAFCEVVLRTLPTILQAIHYQK